MKTMMKLMVLSVLSVVVMNVLPSAAYQKRLDEVRKRMDKALQDASKIQSITVERWGGKDRPKTFSVKGWEASNILHFQEAAKSYDKESRKLEVTADRGSDEDHIKQVQVMRLDKESLEYVLVQELERKINAALKILNTSSAGKEGGAQAIIEEAKAALQQD